MLEENNLIANIYQKKYFVPVYSGTLAIEGILKILKASKKSKVLISSFACYSILEAIINAGLDPIIATPSNGIVFDRNELNKLIHKEQVEIFIAIHQYGYYQYIPTIDNVIVIEDLSQAWNIKYKKQVVGSKSDYLIFSFGKTKPLSNGIGGIILSDNNILNFFDLKIKDYRYSKIPLLEYYMSSKINYRNLIKKANKTVKKQRKNAKLFDKIFNNTLYIDKLIDYDVTPSYHRYVIKVPNKDLEMICSMLLICNIKFQKEFKIKLCDLPVTKLENVKVKKNKRNENYTFLLLRTDNKKRNIKKLMWEVKKNEKRTKNNVC